MNMIDLKAKQFSEVLMETLKRYFWPYPSKDISESGNEYLKESLKKASFWGMPDFTDNRNVWDKHADNSARKKNREWLKPYGTTFAKRWGVLSFLSWLLAWVAQAFY